MNAIHPLATSLLAAVGLLIGTAPAQYYWPAAYANTPGNAVMNAPFTAMPGQPTQRTRCMVILDAASLPFAANTVLTQLSFRRDASYTAAAYPAISGTLRVRVGRAAVAPDAVRDVRFARLFDGQPTTVHNSTSVAPFTVPAASPPSGGAQPFAVVVPFSTATYTYTGGPLAIDIEFVPTAGTAEWRIDAFAIDAPSSGSQRLLGSGCMGSNGFRPFHYALPETTYPGATLTVQMEGSVRSATPGTLQDFAMHMVGLSNTMTSGALPLPLDLAAATGMPSGCMLRVDPLITRLVPVQNPSANFARAISQLPLPNNSLFVGLPLSSQWLAFDDGVAAAAKATVSDGVEITLGPAAPPAAPRLATTIWKYGAAGTDNDSGRMVPRGYGPVLRFN